MTEPRARVRQSVEKLPKECIQNLYRRFVTAPRNEEKGDMVNVLWRYSTGRQAESFWRDVELEWEYVDRCKLAKVSNLPKPKF